MANVVKDEECSAILGEPCFICLDCGATSTGSADKLTHYAKCDAPKPIWFEES